MARVKFNVNTEYAYIQNFKILQSGLSSCGQESVINNLLIQIASPNIKSSGLYRLRHL